MPPLSSPAPEESKPTSTSATTSSNGSTSTAISSPHPRDVASANAHSNPFFMRPEVLTDGLIHPLAGATAGLVSGVFTCPLDVIKTKLQAQGGWVRMQSRRSTKLSDLPGMRYRGLIGTSRMILSEDGIRGMYRGLGPLIMGYLPTWMVYFTVYENTKAALDPGEKSYAFSSATRNTNVVVSLDSDQGEMAVSYPLCHLWGCLLDDLHQSHMGYQNPPNVTSKNRLGLLCYLSLPL